MIKKTLAIKKRPKADVRKKVNDALDICRKKEVARLSRLRDEFAKTLAEQGEL